MRRILMVAAALLLVPGSAALACSCTAPDGSCSASTHCPGGCYAICGAGGCSSGCSGPRENSLTVSFSGQGVSPADLQQRLSDDLGVQFVFAAKKVDDQFTVDIENASVKDLMVGLSKIGATAVLDRRGPEEKAVRPFARHFSLKAENVPVEAVSRVLAEIFGDSIAIKMADPNGAVSLDLENVTLNDIRGDLPRIAGIELEARPK